MPQHPKYSNSPTKNLNDLYKLLSDLEKFGLIHEELHQPIDSLMSGLYPDAAYKHQLDENQLPLDTVLDEEEIYDLEYSSIPSVGELWDYIQHEEQEQFIQDFRNVISLCMYDNAYKLMNDQDTYKTLIEMRDIEYYRMHVYLSEDSETIKRFETYQRTVWFPNSVVPSRVGIYEISSNSHDEPKLAGYAYWDGNKWHDSCILLKDCINQVRSNKTEARSNYYWRGFLNQITNE